MNPSSVYLCNKWCTVIGSFLLVFPVGVTWYWGNVSVYALSYVIKHLPSSSGVEAPWVMSLILLGSCIGIFGSAVLKRYIGKRLTLIIGILIFTSGCVGAYFTVQFSLTAMNVFMGLVTSIGTCVIEGVAVLCSVEWSLKDMGKVTAVVMSGSTAGAIVINEFATLYVNPNNLLPDKQVGQSKFFSQSEVVDTVPFMFLMIAFIALGVCILGALLIRERQETKKDGSTELEDIDNCTEVDVSKESEDVSPRQVVCSPIFYCFCLCYIFGEVSYIIIENYFKAYGQLYIRDDHFLTNLSTAMLVVVTISRLLWGIIQDRYGIKTTFVLYYSGSAITMLWVYFSVMIHKWCYVIIVLTAGCFASHVFHMFSFAALKSFGKVHFLYNLGLIMSPSLIVNMGLAPLFECILENLGWFYVFGFCSCCNTLAVIVTVIVVTNDKAN